MWLKIKSQFLKSLPLTPNGKDFITSALGKDSEILNDGFVEIFWSDFEKISGFSSPIGDTVVYGGGVGVGIRGKNVVPGSVSGCVGLEEPPVVPEFLRDLGLKG